MKTSTQLAYQDQSASQLKLHLIQGMADVSALQVLCLEQIQFGPIKIEAGILGASHYIKWGWEGQAFTEVLACVDALPNQVYYSSTKLPDLNPAFEIEPFPKWKYQFQYQQTDWEEGKEQAAKMIKKQLQISKPQGIGLHFCFPGSTGAETILLIEKGKKAIFTQSLHAYPNEGQMVFSKSYLINK